MNKWIGMGRLVRDPQIRTYGENNDKKMARFTVACDRRGKKEEGQQTADFIGCICYGKQADFVDQYLRQGTKVAIVGSVNTGKYQNKDGQTVYTTDIMVNEIEFAESKRSADQSAPSSKPDAYDQMEAQAVKDGQFMSVPKECEASLPWE